MSDTNKKKKEALWGPFFRFYTRFQIPWIYYIVSIVLGICAAELALRIAAYTVMVNKGELYNGMIVGYVLISILNALVNGFQNVFTAYAAQKVKMRAQGVVWNKILRLPMREIDKTGPSNLISGITNDVEQASSALTSLFSTFSSLYAFIRAILIMVAYNADMSKFLLFSIPLAILTFFVVGRLDFISYRKKYAALNQMTSFFSEHISAAKHIKAQGMEEDEIAEGYKAINARYRADLLYTIFGVIEQLCFQFYINANMIMIAVGGSSMIRKGTLESTAISTFATYSGKVEQYESELLTHYQSVKGTQGSLRQVNHLLTLPSEKVDEGECLSKEECGDLSFSDVFFSFDGEYQVLKGVSFTIPKGKKTAIIGGNGSGKSTIIKLLQGYYTPDRGSICIGKKDLKEIKPEEVRKNFAYVLQNTPLLAGTIRDNISYGFDGDVSEEDMITAAKKANADIFIQEFDKGYDSLVGSSGSRVSGGQRQRIAIARALLVKPSYLVLDEATASLDHDSATHVMKMVWDDSDQTVIYISHNMEEVMKADHVIVMNRGTVEATGTPEEMWKISSTFRDYFERQKQEVAV